MDTWDYQWLFTQLYHNKISIFPAQNLIKNIGFSKNATHTFHTNHPASFLSLSPMLFPLKEPKNEKVDISYENNYIKKIWFNYKKESLYKILRSDFLNTPVVTNIINTFRSEGDKAGV